MISISPIRVPSRFPCLVAWALLLASCAGGAGGSSTLPHEEGALLDLVPRDAFIAGRFDVEALRGTPEWPQLIERLRAQEPDLVRIAEGTSRLYVAVGGLVDAPPPPRVDDGQGYYREPPPWVEWADRFGGRVPLAVAIVQGAAAELCVLLAAEGEHQTRGGYRVTDIEGVSVLTRGADLCALTLTPTASALLAQAGALPAIVQQLGGEPNAAGQGPIARLALDLESPALRAMMERFGERAPRPGDDELPEGLNEEEAALYRDQQEAERRQVTNRATFARAVLAILAEGLATVQWQIAADSDGFETRTEVRGLDEARLGMWRELTAMFFDIARAAVRSDTLGGSDGTAEEFVRDVRLDALDGGYVIVRRTRRESLARLLEIMLPGPTRQVVESAVEPAPALDPTVQARIYEAMSAGPAAIIEAVEPNLDAVRAMTDPYEQRSIILALVRAHATLGHYVAARTLLESSLAWAREFRTGSADEEWREATVRASVCDYGTSACELHLAQGHAELALAAAQSPSGDPARACDVESFAALSCALSAMASLGRTDEALARLEAEGPTGDPLAYVEARARVLLVGGRGAEAYALTRSVCVGGPGGDGCASLAVVLAESLASSATAWTQAQPVVVALEGRYAATGIPADERSLRVEAATCELRARLDGASETTRAACAAALERAISLHGEGHARVATIRLAHARALERGRLRAEAAAQRALAQPIVDALGPQHVLRRRPTR